MSDTEEKITQDATKVARMDIPAINACASYSYGYTNVHRQLAKARAQQAGRLDVTEEDVAVTAIEACRAYLRDLEQSAAYKQSKRLQS